MFNLYKLEEVDATGFCSMIWVEELVEEDVETVGEAKAYLAGCNRGKSLFCIVDTETNTILYGS